MERYATKLSDVLALQDLEKAIFTSFKKSGHPITTL